jgi:hypothetical protein
MYSPRITAEKIAETSKRQGWDLEPSSPAKIRAAIAYFDDKAEKAEGGDLALTAEETRFIQNERRLCALDFRYYIRNYCYIIDWEKNKSLFRPNVAQSMILDLWGEIEERGAAIMMQQLKARQLGCTTLSELATAHRVQFAPLTKAVVASADPKKTIEMGQMIRFCWENQPWWLIPSSPQDRQEKNMTVEFAQLRSSILIQAGNQFHGVGRGGTPNVAHLSELSSWADAADDVDAALIRAVHPTPDVFFVLESTALGRDNWWYENWELIKRDYPRGRSLIRPVFLPWYVGTDIWPTETILQMMPIPIDWIPSDRTIHHAERARQYVLSNPLLLKYLAKGCTDWQMPRAQMWFYEVEREAAIAKKSLNKFLSEMPSDDTEAFQNTGLSVIDQDVILNYRERAREPLGAYAIIGEGIYHGLIPPRHLWWTGPDAPKPITVHVSAVTRSTEVYQFIPLKIEDYQTLDPMFKLLIWEWPEDGETYGLGVDTSDGIGQDWSVIEGVRKSTLTKPWAQVCEFSSPYIKADQLWPMTLAIGTFYSTYNERVQRRTQCRIAIECRGNGDMVQSAIKGKGWINLHPWKKYDVRKPIPDGKVHHEGVFTNVSFRAAMMDKLLSVIDEEALEIGSKWFVNEMATLERDVDEKSARAAYNTHDDRILAMGFAIFSLQPPDSRDRRYRANRSPAYLAAVARQAEDRQIAATGYATWSPPIYAQDLGRTLTHHPVERDPQGHPRLARLHSPGVF